MSEIVCSVEHVSKKLCRNLGKAMVYTLGDVGRASLGFPAPGDKLRPGEFWGVKDVSFDLRKGECMGLIGANGAGKSTLLKMINGILRPNVGQITINGRVSALIEVTAGFHPMLSGKENIYINGSILGMSKKEIDRKYDAIVEFSGLDDAMLNAAVKTYSSGMYVRLGFSIAIHSEPDLLLIDEVLAVGDIAFIGKCHTRVQELMRNGVTCVLVSHSTTIIDAFCQRALLLNKGQVVEMGPARNATTKLRQMMVAGEYLGQNMADNIKRSGVGITFVRIMDENGQDVGDSKSGQTRVIQFGIHAAQALRKGSIIIWLQRYVDRLMISSSYIKIGEDVDELTSGSYSVDMPFYGMPGEYWLGVTVTGEDRVERLAELMTPKFILNAGDEVPEPVNGDTRQGSVVVPVRNLRRYEQEAYEPQEAILTV